MHQRPWSAPGAGDRGLVLGQREVDGKSNEITAVPECSTPCISTAAS
jgi:hypothetical protein